MKFKWISYFLLVVSVCLSGCTIKLKKLAARVAAPISALDPIVLNSSGVTTNLKRKLDQSLGNNSETIKMDAE